MINDTNQLTKKPNSITKYVVAMAFLTLSTNPALASLQGGIDKATGIATQIKVGLLAIAAIGAVIYLLIKALECWNGRADWKEFGLAVLYVAMAGGAAALANWAWTAFT